MVPQIEADVPAYFPKTADDDTISLPRCYIVLIPRIPCEDWTMQQVVLGLVHLQRGELGFGYQRLLRNCYSRVVEAEL